MMVAQQSPQPAVPARRKGGTFFVLTRLILGLVFIWMGLSKTGLVNMGVKEAGLWDNGVVQKALGLVDLSDPIDFLKLTNEYKIIPQEMPVLLNFTAGVLPWLEIWCGVTIILGVGVRGTAFILFVLLSFFTWMVTERALDIQQAQGVPFCSIEFDCGCGAGVVNICRKLIENGLLWLFTLYLMISRSRRLCLIRKVVPNNLGVKKDQ